MKTLKSLERITKGLIFRMLGRLLGNPKLPDRFSIESVERILLLRHDALGDMILSTPIWRTLKARKPSLVIGVLGGSRNVDLLRSDRDIDFVYELSDDLGGLFGREIKRAKLTDWDVVVNLVYNDKTRGAILARKISKHAPRITAVREQFENYSMLYAHLGLRPPYRPPTPILEQSFLSVNAAFPITPTDQELHPTLILDPIIVKEVSNAINSIQRADGTTMLLHLNTEASEDFREWGLENSFKASRELLTAHKDLLIFWTAAPPRSGKILQFLEEHPIDRLHYFPTKTSQHLASLVRRSHFVISPDTSVIHMASAERKPVVGLYIERNEYLPYRTPAKLLFPTDGKPMRSIAVEAVVAATNELIAECLESRS